MDEMPGGVLNGFTLNDAIMIRIEENKNRYEKEQGYINQRNACLSREDAKLFYKLYFGLLEFTNNKYKIKRVIKFIIKRVYTHMILMILLRCFGRIKIVLF